MKKKRFFQFRAVFLYHGQSRWNLLLPILYELWLAVLNLVIYSIVAFVVAAGVAALFGVTGPAALFSGSLAFVIALVLPLWRLGLTLIQGLLAPFFVHPNTKVLVVTHAVRVGNLDVYQMPRSKPAQFKPYLTRMVANGLPRDESDDLFRSMALKQDEFEGLPQSMPEHTRIVLNIPTE